MHDKFSIIFGFFNLFMFYLAYLWIQKMEDTKCTCGEDYKKDFIKHYIAIEFLFATIFFFISLFFTALLVISSTIRKILFTILNNKTYEWWLFGIIVLTMLSISIFMSINVTFSLYYINNLKKNNCKCSEDIKREIYYLIIYE